MFSELYVLIEPKRNTGKQIKYKNDNAKNREGTNGTR